MHRRVPYTAWNVATVALAVVAVAIVIWLLGWGKVLNDRAAEQEQQITVLSQQYKQLYDEATAKGVRPTIAPDPADLPSPPADVVLIPGPRGAQGDKGDKGDQGAACLPFVVGCQGPQGIPGIGTQGEWGLEGSDGLPCLPEIPECRGPAGEDGQDGTNGTDGAPGQPPVSWTVENPAGVKTTCTRTDPFDPAAPTYVCTNDPPVEP